MAWCQSTSHYLKQWRLVYWRIYTSRGLYDLGIMKDIRRKLARFIYPSWRWNWNPQIYCIEAHPLLRCGCLWVGATSVYFSINYVFVILRILLVFAVGSQCQHDFSIIWRTQTVFKNSLLVWILNGVVGQILIKLETSFIWSFLQLSLWYPLGVTYANMLVTTQLPLKRAPHLQQCGMEV